MHNEKLSTIFKAFGGNCTVDIAAYHGRGPAQGSPLTLNDYIDLRDLFMELQGVVRSLEHILYTPINRSELSSLLRRYIVNKPFEVSPLLFSFLERSLELCKLTNGEFDITAGPMLEAWRLKREGFETADEAMKHAKKRVNYKFITLPQKNHVLISRPNVVINPEASSIGAAVDATAEFLRKKGVESAYINICGRICCIGEKLQGVPYSVCVGDSFRIFGRPLLVNLTDAVTAEGKDSAFGFERGDALYPARVNYRSGKRRDTGIRTIYTFSKSGFLADAITNIAFFISWEGTKALLAHLKAHNQVDCACYVVFKNGNTEIFGDLDARPL